MLDHGIIVYDALYAWCRSEAASTERRTPQ
jgi:hypothetical protein